MGQLGKDVAQVAIQSDWWSKINWAQVVGWVCSGLVVVTGGKFDLDTQTQAYIVFVIQGAVGLITGILRRYTVTITPTAAARLEKAKQT